MSIENILNYYKSEADKASQNIKWNPKATDEVRKKLLEIASSTSWVPLIAGFEGYRGRPYSEHRSRVPLEKSQTKKSGGWFKVYVNGRKVGQATIGYGHVLHYRHAGGQMEEWWDPFWGKNGQELTREQARQLLYHNGRARGYKLLKRFTAVPTQSQYDVILSRSYIGGLGSRGMHALIRHVNSGNSQAFNNKLKNWYNYLYSEKYKDPNWCQKNVNQLSGKRYDGKTDAQKIEKCKAKIEYDLRYRTGWKRRTDKELKYVAGNQAVPGPDISGDTTSASNIKTGQKIALIGDSNALRLNKEYEKHFKALGAEVHRFHFGGTGCKYWLRVLQRLDEMGDKKIRATNKINSGAWRLQNFFQKGGGSVGDAQIHVVCLGGNNMNLIYKESNIKNHVEGCIKPLMQLIKKYDGTFAGTVPVGSRRVGKNGEKSNVLRAKMNAAYEAAAKQVGVPFWNPTANIAYDTDALSRRKDSVHITRDMARKEFESRKAFLSGHAQVTNSPTNLKGGFTGTYQGADDEKKQPIGSPRDMSDMPEMDISPEQLVAWVRKMNQGGYKEPKQREIIDAAIAAFEKKMPHLKGKIGRSTSQPIDDPIKPEEDVPPRACPDGTFVKKYKNFPAQVPDFNFSTFYDELDKYFGSAEEELKPQGKDCVFGDEHYAAWVRLQQKKQMNVPYVSEVKSLLGALIDEMKKRY